MTQTQLFALQQRAFLYRQIRHFFAQRKVLEVETPILSSAANSDVEIEVFSTQAIAENKSAAYLRTSPEFFHKRLLAAGSGDVFEIAKVFRQAENTAIHNPEFTLLEWYRQDYSLFQLMDEVAELIQQLRQDFKQPELAVQSVSYVELMQQHCGLNPLQLNQQELNQLCRQHGYHGEPLGQSAAFDFLFAIVVEPQLRNLEQGLFIYHFPACQAALAQLHPQQPQLCLRFEFLYQGIELANGYQELTDPEQQLQRFNQDQQLRAAKQRPTHPIDRHLIKALTTLPDCSGVAIGLDRLLMVLLNHQNLDQILPFSAEIA